MDQSKENGLDRRRALKLMGITAAAGAISGVVSCGGEKAILGLLAIDGPLSRKSFSNMLRMGHCAPTVLRTLLEADGIENRSLIKLAAGLPGGIGNHGGECGGVTAAVIYLGLRYGNQDREGFQRILAAGRIYFSRFVRMNGSLDCREIQNRKDGLKSCIKAMCASAGLLRNTVAEFSAREKSMDPAAESARYSGLIQEWRQRDFHCALSVLRELKGIIPVDTETIRAASGFQGGTLLLGKTCSALTAGVMAIGARIGEIENSRLRVLGMVLKMMTRGDAMKDEVNRFNRSINAGRRLVECFKKEFGATRCQDLVRCDFSTVSGVESYVSGGRASFCQNVAVTVSGYVKKILQDLAG